MNQAHIILIASALGMAVYAGCAIKRRMILKADDLLTFALWCAGAITGFFAFAGAFKLSKQVGQETNGLYVGIFGLCLVWLSLQKAVEMIRELFLKALPPPTSSSTDTTGAQRCDENTIRKDG
jgi:FtsH-binding integral membrane protein